MYRAVREAKDWGSEPYQLSKMDTYLKLTKYFDSVGIHFRQVRGVKHKKVV